MARFFPGLPEFATFTAAIAVVSDKLFFAGLGVVAKNIHGHAVKVIGDQDKLQPLAESTVESKSAKGYIFPDAPLIATGAMQQSLEWFAVGPAAGVGSEDPKLLWHHLGGMTGRNHATTLPARPVLDVAFHETEAENIALMEVAAAKAVGI